MGGMMPMDDDDEGENGMEEDNGIPPIEDHTDELPSLIKPSTGPLDVPSSTIVDSTTFHSETPNNQRSPLSNCIKENSRCIKNQRRRMSMPGCSKQYSQCVAKATSSSRSRIKYKP